MESIIVALITGGLALIGVVITNIANSKRVEAQFATAQAITDTKLEGLTIEVKRHNKSIDSVPILETRLCGLEMRIEKLDKKIENLDQKLESYVQQ